MSTKIRLARGGSKKRPFYRIVVADSRSARDGKFIEKIGTYNPLIAKGEEGRVELKAERVTDWLSKGAIPSERVMMFLNDAKLGQEFKAVKDLNRKRNNVIKLKSAEIAERKKKEAAEKAIKDAEAKAAAEAAEKEAKEAAAAAEAAAKEAEEAAAKEAAEAETAAKAEAAEAPAETAAVEVEEKPAE